MLLKTWLIDSIQEDIFSSQLQLFFFAYEVYIVITYFALFWRFFKKFWDLGLFHLNDMKISHREIPAYQIYFSEPIRSAQNWIQTLQDLTKIGINISKTSQSRWKLFGFVYHFIQKSFLCVSVYRLIKILWN